MWLVGWRQTKLNNAVVALEQQAESTGVGEYGDKNGLSENSKEQDCEVSGSIVG